ncbi:MAG: ATP-binding protein [Chloroflexota bacterium]
MSNPFRTLRSRLIVSYLALIVFGFGALAFIAGDEIETGLQEAYAGNLTTQSALVVRSLQNQSLNNGTDAPDMENTLSIIQKWADELDINITLLDHRGVAWLDSTYGAVNIDLSDEQEVKSAQDGKFVPELSDKDLLGKENAFLHIATPLIVDGAVEGYLRLGQPAAKLQDDIAERWLALGLGVGILGLIAIILSIWNANALSQPLIHLRQTAKRLSDGDLSQRSTIERTDEIGDLAQTFNQMAISVESMLEEQRAFASNASHELRTPLTSIRLRTEYLLSDELDAATETQYLNEIDSEARRLHRMVEDLQFLSQADANRLSAGREEVDVPRVVQAIIRQFESQIQAKAQTVIVEPTSDPQIVTANLNHVHLVLRNIMENAIKYTPDCGSIHWLVRTSEQVDLISQSANPNQAETRQMPESGQVPQRILICQVRDTGIGIEPDELTKLGKRFYRVDKSRSRRVPGNGLGLSLVHSVVMLYGGSVTVDSPGLAQGTTVTIHWPLSGANLEHLALK